MTFNLSKRLMVLLVCLTFVGQTMASTAMSYHMMSMKVMSGQEQSQDMSMMDHSKHKMMSMDSDNSDSKSEDCCDKSCNCMASGCSSISAMLQDIKQNTQPIYLSSKINFHSNLTASQQQKSLYRPPILS